MECNKQITYFARRLSILVSIAAVIPGSILGAGEDRHPFEYNLLFPQSREGSLPSMTVIEPEIAPPMEQPIDPKTYRVVPGDLLQLEVGGETDRAWRLAINAEGKLVLPGSAAIDVVGRTLQEVVGAARETLADRFPGQAIGLHMLQPGAFRVPVTGLVSNPEVQIVHSYDRVSQAIRLAGGPREGASLRRIVVRDAVDGTEREIDLVRFALLGELSENPYLAPGSSIHLPPASAFVQVSGAIRGLPTQPSGAVPNVGARISETPRLLLEWKEGETFSFLLSRAGGLSEEASGQVVLYRGGERQFFDVADVLEMTVRPGDRLEVAMQDRYVYVVGAVRYPGPYAHLPSRTATDYVLMAGGPTQIGRGGGWSIRLPDGRETDQVGSETYIPAGATIHVPERWTYRVSTLLGPISGVTALVISLVALRN